MKNKGNKIIISILSIAILSLIVGFAYSFYNKKILGINNTVIAGDLYLKYNGTNVITESNLRPMTKSEALDRNDNIFEFTITGKNTSKKDLYYGVSIENTGTINDRDIVVYLEEVVEEGENPKVLVDGIRYKDLSKHVYVNYIEKNTSSEINKRYQLRVWLREGIIVSDTEDDADYTTEEWANVVLSLKVKVDGNLSNMNTPLLVDSNNYVSNNKQYILASIKNYENPSEVNELLDTPDTMQLEVTGENTLFSYKDSKGNIVETDSNSLDLTYTMNKKENIDVQIFLKPENDVNTNTDINVKLTKNGNIVYEIIHNIDLVGGNYCLNNGFNKLHDCILVSENKSTSVNNAKTYIANKGSVNLDDTAPSYTYAEEESSGASYTGTSGYKWYFGEKYTFNVTTGTFTLKQSNGTSNATTQYDLDNNAIGKYTCGTTNSGYTNCSTIYKVESIDTGARKITGKKITYKILSSLRSEEGLYEETDTLGKTYFYRGNVTNNNVYFGGYYWKIVRINGDSSIRLIFNGNTTGIGTNNNAISNNANGYGSTYAYNPVHGGPTYVGYMYNEEATTWESSATNHNNFAIGTSYYWSTKDDFEELEDQYGTYFKLKATNNAVQKTIVEMSNDASQLSSTPYTCKGTALTSTCRVLYKVNSVTIGNNNSITTSTNYYTKHPNTSDLSVVNANNKDSNAKRQLELWYENKFKNKEESGHLVTDYIVDNVFCNDRSIIRTNNYKSGYKLTEHTYFAGRTRLLDNTNKSINFSCNSNDKFSSTEELGNAKLKYPVGLITADEVALAGGKYYVKNEGYYLRTNGYFWTMTPSNFYSSNANAYVWDVYPTGLLNNNNVTGSFGVRAVINLSSQVLISSGDGTLDNPYRLKLS